METRGDRNVPRRVLAGWHGSEAGRDALHLAADLANLFDARLIIGCVVDPGLTPPELSRHRDAWAARFHELLAAAHNELRNVEFSVREALDDPAAGLRELAVEEAADVVVLGSTHHGTLGRLIPGTVAERLLEDPPCAIAIAPHDYGRAGPHLGYGIVGVGYDGTPSARAALAFAQFVAEATGGEVRIVSIAPDYVDTDLSLGPLEPVRQEAQLRLERAVKSVDEDIPTSGVVMSGDAAAVLEEQAVELDLLVIGSRGRGPIRDRLFGSVSADVIRRAPCPVIVVPREPSV